MGKKGNSSAVFVLTGVVGGIALLGILIIALGGKKTTPVADIVKVAAGIEKAMILIPAGKFKMGSPASEKGRSGDETQYEVTITKPFYMGKFEVTQEQWEAVMGSNPSSRTKGAKLPVTDVSWDDCQEFIKKLNSKTDGGYRLPTEAEWEYACRAGTTTPYSYGDSLTKSDANINGDRIKAAGSYLPNAFGLYDMHGNVWEWCNDWHGALHDGEATHPKGPATGERRVLRGGSFYSNVSIAHSSFRNYLTPSHRYVNNGFRLARTL
jgi:formylglycine-generating enzyme required for sulfatase activity